MLVHVCPEVVGPQSHPHTATVLHPWGTRRLTTGEELDVQTEGNFILVPASRREG